MATLPFGDAVSQRTEFVRNRPTQELQALPAVPRDAVVSHSLCIVLVGLLDADETFWMFKNDVVTA